MKLNTAKEVWIGRIIAWLILGAISLGIIFATTFIIGPALFVIPNLSDKLAVAMFCPGAESSSVQEGASVPTTSSPSGTHGHTVEVTCYYADGSTTTINNGQYAIAAIGGVFGIGGLIGILISIPLMFSPFILIRKKKIAD
ncbi:MAG: hypothetical protein IT311_10820 [Anaerolineales bacterium]|nr:hypothetical protein [Anaerolineales bacterium]